jgi:hypothetical protein
VAYSRHYPGVGYCQGLSFIGARLLAWLEEEAAFWCLAQIVCSLLPCDYYTTMVGILIDQRVFADLLASELSEYKDHLLSLGGTGFELPLMSTVRA